MGYINFENLSPKGPLAKNFNQEFARLDLKFRELFKAGLKILVKKSEGFLMSSIHENLTVEELMFGTNETTNRERPEEGTPKGLP